VTGTHEADLAELHKAICHFSSVLRGSAHSWDIKSYLPGLLFYWFVAENLAVWNSQGGHNSAFECEGV